MTADRLVFWQDQDFWVLPLTGGAKPQEFQTSKGRELFGQISPNGRWFVYTSFESGRAEAFVTSFPERTGKWLISTKAATFPDGHAMVSEIFYMKQDHATMFAAAVGEEAGSFRIFRRDRLFSVQMLLGRGWPYDVAPDGKRFLAVVSSGSTTAPLTLVVDWPSEVRR